MRQAGLTDSLVSRVTLFVACGLAGLVLVVLGLIASPAAGAPAPRLAHVQAAYAAGFSSSAIYGYDSPSAFTTPTAKLLTAAHEARRAPAGALRLSSRFSRRFLATKGADDVPAATPVGSSRSPMNTADSNRAARVDGRRYSGHALDRMQGRDQSTTPHRPRAEEDRCRRRT